MKNLSDISKPWRNRIVGYSEEPPEQLVPSPWNWRVHPQSQQDALASVLDTVGLVQNIICNRATGHVVDGHLRIMLALREGQAVVPVTWIEVSEDEEKFILATHDPLAAMATADPAALEALLGVVQSGEAAVQTMLAEMAQNAGIVPPDVEFREYDETAAEEVEYHTCPNCGHQWPK